MMGLIKFRKALGQLSISIFMLLVIVQVCQCVRFHLQPHSRRCLKHEMYANQLAVGEYEVSSLAGTTVDLTITDTQGHTALSRDNIDGKGKFAVTSDRADFYDLCFTYTSAPSGGAQLLPREIYIDYRVGAEAKHDNQPVQDDKLSELERGLTRVEDLTNSIIVDFAYLKKREQEMRDTNDSTNLRLFYQGVTSVIILLVLACWQTLYLRTFFKARKLID